MAKQTSNDKLPVHTIRHRSLKAAIWRNTTPKGMMYNVTVMRSYRDRESGKWHESHSFGYDDLMNVAALLQDAHRYISDLKAREPKRKKADPASASRT